MTGTKTTAKVAARKTIERKTTDTFLRNNY